ncbi:HigA family addiction module antitoxin [Thalassotalea euphylliae]|uniref:Addiction module antidote protein, HigA family n=1 Tax=Thalassotalea euphylliae TaxID=1655234 RepID=A0A3E0U5W9_9GAMM|nr:HigA family addiction module antitoxin [Thalassotalea euphylliae]REL31987.1 addiction module antidote protein, HigA family [Thalassotalea euphylliae]
MSMHNPPHPGEFIFDVYMKPFGYSCRFVAKQLDVSASTLNRILKCQSSITPEMSLRLSRTLGRTPESWLLLQSNYDLWQAKQRVNLSKVHSIDFAAV